VNGGEGAFQQSHAALSARPDPSPEAEGWGRCLNYRLAQRLWHFEQKCDDRCATKIRRTGAPHVTHGSSGALVDTVAELEKAFPALPST